MKLSDAAIESGDVFLFHGRAPHSRLIELHTNSDISHAALALTVRCFPGGQPILCIEALEGKGVRCCPLDRYLVECAAEDCRVDWYAVDPCWGAEKGKMLKAEAGSEAAAFAVEQLGKDYVSMGQLSWSFGWLGSTFRRLLAWCRPAANLNPDRWFCSELVAGCHKKAGFPVDEDPALISPADVARFPWLTLRGALEPDQ